MVEINGALYWSLPGPTMFVQKVKEAARSARAIILSLPDYTPATVWGNVERALQDAEILEPLTLRISSGMSVEAEIGMHFGTSVMSGDTLAHEIHPISHAVILRPEDSDARNRCAKFAESFIDGVEHSNGNVTLIISLHDGEFREDADNDRVRVISFDSMLNEAEIEAYVTQRVVGRKGPGSTRLIKHLIIEYAGYDPYMAEALINLEDSMIMGLPESLNPLLGAQGLRWAEDSWIKGTRILRLNSRHSLREWHIATHPGPNAAGARRDCEKRYWRACVKALLPWLEERRPVILRALETPLTTLERQYGVGKIPKKIGERNTEIAREDMEYNDLWYNFKSSADSSSMKERSAIVICKIAKDIRNNISHLEAPLANNIMELIERMDAMTSVEAQATLLP